MDIQTKQHKNPEEGMTKEGSKPRIPMSPSSPVKFCIRCTINNQRPGIVFDSEGVCSACRHAEYKKTVDWVSRERQFGKLCEKNRRSDGEYDCIIAVSSGKDSFWQTWLLTQKYDMHPMLVNVDNGDWTITGLENFKTMQDQFNCEAVVLKSNKSINRKISRLIFEHDGFMYWLFDRYIYTFPLWTAIKFNIPLVFYGENVPTEYGGSNAKDTPSALDQINNDVVRDYGWEFFEKNGIHKSDIPLAKYPSPEQITQSGLDVRYMSYYFNWSGYQHMVIAKENGWKSLDDTSEWKRQGWVDDYNQIDDFAYLVDPWMKYPKYGHRQVTDITSRLIRDGIITREMGVKAVRKYDPILDPIALEHYLKFSGYSEDEFWSIVDRFYNKNLFYKDGKQWVLKEPIS